MDLMGYVKKKQNTNKPISDPEFSPGKDFCSCYVTWLTEINYYFTIPPNNSMHGAGSQLHKQYPVCAAYWCLWHPRKTNQLMNSIQASVKLVPTQDRLQLNPANHLSCFGNTGHKCYQVQ